MADEKNDIAKLKELAKNAEESKLTLRIAEIRRENNEFKNKFYSMTTEDGIVNNIKEIVKNCPSQTKKQLQEFLQLYRGNSDRDLNVEDILGYIDTINAYFGNGL